MPRKKSVKKAASEFIGHVKELEEFVQTSISGLSDKHQTWCHDYAIIRLYREFEQMMLSAIVAAINNDTTTISESTRIRFPKHLNDEVCEYLVLGGGYFDFKGRDGLIKTMRKFIPETHYLVEIVKKSEYKDALEQLTTLRNFAAHESTVSKQGALKATNQSKIGSAGSWLKTQGRYYNICHKLKKLGEDIKSKAPY